MMKSRNDQKMDSRAGRPDGVSLHPAKGPAERNSIPILERYELVVLLFISGRRLAAYEPIHLVDNVESWFRDVAEDALRFDGLPILATAASVEQPVGSFGVSRWDLRIPETRQESRHLMSDS